MERADYTMFGQDWIGFIQGARSRAPYDDFDSSVKRMNAEGSIYSAKDQSGVKCRLWVLKEPKGSPASLDHVFQRIVTCDTVLCQ